jgi:Transglutaminase-like superfamily
MIRKLYRYLSLRAAERRLLFEALTLPCCIWLGFRLLGVPRTQALLRSWTGAGVAAPGLNPASDREFTIHHARGAQRIVKRTTGIGRNCLVRSLTLWSILLRRGIPTDLRVGFRKREGRFEGHAWLEYDGVPINETLSEARSYAPYDQPVTFDLWRQLIRERANP